jgi:probable HAF family extracellular repeat protein
MALAISDTGFVAGKSETSAGPHAFVWSREGDMLDLGTLPGDSESQAMGVNNNATVVGYSGTGATSRAFVWTSRSGMSPLPSLAGATIARALAINNSGQIVGFSTAGDHAYRAVTWGSDGRVVDLNTRVPQPASVLLVEAQAINSGGQILAYGFRLPLDHDIHEKPGRMFLLTPSGTATRGQTAGGQR